MGNKTNVIRSIDANALIKALEAVVERLTGVEGSYLINLIPRTLIDMLKDPDQIPTLDYEPRQKWTCAKDETPKKWKETDGTLVNYLVFMPEYGVDVGNYLETAKTWVCMGLPVNVTHWMLMPEPPQEGKA